MEQPYPCIKCKKEVWPWQEALQCDSCEKWQHRTSQIGNWLSLQTFFLWSKRKKKVKINVIIISFSCRSVQGRIQTCCLQQIWLGLVVWGLQTTTTSTTFIPHWDPWWLHICSTCWWHTPLWPATSNEPIGHWLLSWPPYKVWLINVHHWQFFRCWHIYVHQWWIFRCWLIPASFSSLSTSSDWYRWLITTILQCTWVSIGGFNWGQPACGCLCCWTYTSWIHHCSSIFITLWWQTHWQSWFLLWCEKQKQ